VTVPAEEAPANYVPAAAVIRRVRALSGIIGRKELVGGLSRLDVKTHSSTPGLRGYGQTRVLVGETGIPGVAVECADIRRNTGGEGRSLGHN
jgi:hypothetical protein